MNTTPRIGDGDSPINSPLLTRVEAAAYLRRSVRHIDNLRKRGELQATLDGSCVCYLKSVLDDYIRRHTESAKGPADKDSELNTAKPNPQSPESGGRHAQDKDRDQERDGSEPDERYRTRHPPRDAA
jgi:hypothetical protein